MNATRFGLLKRDVAEAFQVTDLSDFDTFALLVGRVTLLLFGAFLLFGIVSASYRFTVKQFKGWLTKEGPRCTCMRVASPVLQNTATPAEIRSHVVIPDPLCEVHR